MFWVGWDLIAAIWDDGHKKHSQNKLWLTLSNVLFLIKHHNRKIVYYIIKVTQCNLAFYYSFYMVSLSLVCAFIHCDCDTLLFLFFINSYLISCGLITSNIGYYFFLITSLELLLFDATSNLFTTSLQFLYFYCYFYDVRSSFSCNLFLDEFNELLSRSTTFLGYIAVLL